MDKRETTGSNLRVAAALACIALTATTIPVAAFASQDPGKAITSLSERNVTAVEEGAFENNSDARWALGSDGTLAIRGSGSIPADNALCDMEDQVRHLFIGKEIDSIQAEAFSYFADLESIEFEEGSLLEKIEPYAFAGCRSLEYISLPSLVKTIGDAAFLDCEQLRRVELSNSLESIKASAFANCKSMRELALPDSLKEIGCYAFNGCASLMEIVIPPNVQTVGEEAFGDCSALDSVVVKDPSKTSIDNFAFAGQTKAKPATISIKSVKANKKSIKVTWSKVAGCKRYKLYYKQESSKSYHSKLVKNSNSKTIRKLKSKAHYQVYVVAQKDGAAVCRSLSKTSGKVR